MKYLILLSITCMSCTNLDFGQQVTYRINGGRMLIEYQVPGEENKTDLIYTAWDTEFIGHAGDEVYIKAINDGNPGGMSVTIYRDGQEWITESTMSEFDTITISDKIPFRF